MLECIMLDVTMILSWYHWPPPLPWQFQTSAAINFHHIASYKGSGLKEEETNNFQTDLVQRNIVELLILCDIALVVAQNLIYNKCIFLNKLKMVT